MSYETRSGIKILDGEDVPDGELHIEVPGPEGTTFQYRYFISDHALTSTQPGKTCMAELLDQLSKLLRDAETTVAIPPELLTARIRVMQSQLQDFGKGHFVSLEDVPSVLLEITR